MKRPHRRASEWQTLISQWQASGLSAPAFCEQHSIGYASFCQWRQRLRSADGVEEPAVSANTFIDLGALSAGHAALGQGWHIVLSLGNGVELRLSQR
ncbi:IS66 family insertion sequence element accessory protein TnpA [Thiothrix subterranea]|uniref:IS66 family insertion sequence element accessory protein TnpB n=1 Tax=Thiothrix subterranea TaxID=2735563 RepID=A0AA51MQ47_9GAMM|nr:IS66 family insertion sequence element accessory protein TnpB [Thiothrix subterranea]WML85650.1 IS66 family insertion sequence element accessory protein TnpB [Thiothrix subterranea]WML86202.1 IS66 family insertion sequence element accessory protein TnpB [Thiothrix subterranea]WML86206.1 IS66 family insertion sequence element accessory protein TnpB [Thiothrix subterranea]WML86305.1 IS66 family insertion sequence element accessory protein TnpB [Thiothrix subterranea]WML87581.1 IS66 family ins